MSTTFSIDGDGESILQSAFALEHSRLRFGCSGCSATPCTHIDLMAHPIEFHDYVMEGFVKYSLHASRTANGIDLTVEPLGSNRDAYIPIHIRFHLEQAKLTISAIKNRETEAR